MSAREGDSTSANSGSDAGPVPADPVDPLADPRTRRRLLPLHNAIGHLIRRLDRKAGAYFDERFGDTTLTRSQFVLLMVVVLVPGLEQAEIAKLSGYDAATAGSVIARLEGKNLIERARSMRSRRGWIVSATLKGAELVHGRMGVLEDLQVQLLKPLSADEQLTLMRLLSKMLSIQNSYNLSDD